MKVLIRKPSWHPGSVGDQALLNTIESLFAKQNIDYKIPTSKLKTTFSRLSEFDLLVYFGNDCIAYYEIDTRMINKFLNANKPVIVINTSFGDDYKYPALKQFEDNELFHILIRDKYSLEAINRHFNFKNSPTLVSDLAFLLESKNLNFDPELESWINSNKEKQIVGINVHESFNEHTQTVFDEVRQFIDRNKDTYRFLLIPHDTRKEEKDYVGKLTKDLNNVDFYLSPYLPPEHERYITQFCRFVVTGRMHLSILTIPNEVPCIGIAYNGLKFLGTFEHWGIEDLVIKADEINRIQEYVNKLETNYSEYINKIKAQKEKVEQLAFKQIEYIESIIGKNSASGKSNSL